VLTWALLRRGEFTSPADLIAQITDFTQVLGWQHGGRPSRTRDFGNHLSSAETASGTFAALHEGQQMPVHRV